MKLGTKAHCHPEKDASIAWTRTWAERYRAKQAQ